MALSPSALYTNSWDLHTTTTPWGSPYYCPLLIIKKRDRKRLLTCSRSRSWSMMGTGSDPKPPGSRTHAHPQHYAASFPPWKGDKCPGLQSLAGSASPHRSSGKINRPRPRQAVYTIGCVSPYTRVLCTWAWDLLHWAKGALSLLGW